MESPTCLLICCLLAIGHFQVSLQLTIRHVSIPSAVKLGEAEHVILDCDYDMQNTSARGLVVKWYRNNFDLMYQWIYGSEPQATESAAKYIDLTYKASDDEHTMYRAMKMRSPNTDLSGEYLCQISTFADEQEAKGTMTVYSTETKFDFRQKKVSVDDEDGVEVTCLAEGLYPVPTLDISVEGFPNKHSKKPILTQVKENGRYNIASFMTLKDSEIEDNVVIKCFLGIADVHYNISQQLVYYTGGRPTTTATTTSATTKLLRKMEIQALDKSEPDTSNGGGSGASVTLSSLVFFLAQYAAVVRLNF